ncbi:hypothetical protein DXG01_010652 [Tephrocybe rancida]|nr:hypothetical protein DXG01_010652 [Tephrocybe rancida]
MPTFDRSVYHNHTRTNLVTLFGTACTTINADVPSPPATPPASPPATPTSIPPTSTPSVITTQSTSTQGNGSVVVQTITQTPSPSNTIAVNNKDGSSPNIAPIVGGTVGGFFGLIAIVALIWFILRRRRRWDDIFEKEENDIIAAGARGGMYPARFSLDVDPEPKPYQYGLVGQAIAPSAASPPNSPPMRASAGAGNIHHARTTSLTPLNPVTASNPTLSSRPSTGGSTQPLYPPQQGYTQPGYQQQGYPPPLPTQQPMDLNSNPSSLTHNHSASTASFTSAPVSHAHWAGGVGPGHNAGIGAAFLGLTTPVMIADEEAQNRSGTPTNIYEPRRLQVTNAPEFEFGESSSSAAAAAAAAAVPLRDGKGRIVLRSTGPPVVHQDGGRLAPDVEPAITAAGSSGSGSMPPAYTN